jgi:hypothetical protein
MKLKNLLILSMIFILMCSINVYSQTEVERAKSPFRPAEPPRLYVAPTADIIPSLDISLAGGGSLGENALSYQGTFAIGLADIAQVEASALNIGSSLRESGLGNVYAPGFKMMLLRTGKWKHSSGISSPGLAWALRSSVWNDEEMDRISYGTKVADLYFVATERIGPLSLHGGVDIFDARMRSDENGKMAQIAKRNFMGPFAGLDIWVTERGKAMAEFGWIPNFNYADRKIDNEWLALLGVRFFVTKYVAADVGIRYQGNYEGVSDAKIEIKLDTLIPTHLIYEYARGNK